MESPEQDELYKVRHSASHIMATAILEMFPDAKLAIGPPIKDGFYYDFDLPRPISTEDFEEIETRMKAVIKANQKFLKSRSLKTAFVKTFSQLKKRGLFVP